MADMCDRSGMDTQNKTRDAAVSLGTILAEHKGIDVAVLDLRGSNSWTDFFIIATATSSTHLHGLQKHVLESIKNLDLEVRPTKRKIPDGDEWLLIDLGDVVVHLMSATARSFYDLEKLWFGSPNLMEKKG